MNLTVRMDSLRGLKAGDPFAIWVLQAQQPNSSTLESAEAADWQMISQVHSTGVDKLDASVVHGKHEAELELLSTQARPGLRAVLVFGGQEDSVRMLQQRLGSSGSEILHLPLRTWYEQRWLDMPAGGRPTTGYVGGRCNLLTTAGLLAGVAPIGAAHRQLAVTCPCRS
jgi:hypothetical protein